ncbi:pyruvate, phosphate dikinase [Catenulispora rubra]|uniref:pyruvate, phosphate dikinase n=1 Tax=Catenulispora rubra TaxID=280293 RepID=UPI0018921D3E|nr:pyruvate, phosphate dikinase [Catenulispora rubra]
MDKYVYEFADGGRHMANLLGGESAGLAEMTRMDLPVPPGFTITTEACRFYLEHGREPARLAEEITRAWTQLEASVHKQFGADRPMLVAVRSGAEISMPGMMDTVLNVGLGDEAVEQLASWSGDERFAWEAYSRFVRSFAETVLRLPEYLFRTAEADVRRSAGTTATGELDTARLKTLTHVYQHIVRHETGDAIPRDPRRQLELAVRAVFDSWNGERARAYRNREDIPEDLGTAVNVCLMVFGSLGPNSGTGVAFTRDPATGAPGAYGDYLRRAVGEDIVAGLRNTVPLTELERLDPASYAHLCANLRALETHYRDVCDIEFTIERGTLWMLQTRIGERGAEATFRIASDLVDEGVITPDEALGRVTGERLARLLFPRFADSAHGHPSAHGVAASPGAAVGRIVFDAHKAADHKAKGQNVILVRPQTRPEDLPGMLASIGLLTTSGGKTSHAAVVARGLGIPCVCGAERIELDPHHKTLTLPDGTRLHEGDFLSLDGSTGDVFAGRTPLVTSPVAREFLHPAGGAPQLWPGPEPAHDEAVVHAVQRVLGWADHHRRLGVRANADTATEADQARAFGAEGIGLCRTEHMFLGDRQPIVERLILAETAQERGAALAELLTVQREDFRAILRVMDGLPVAVRLLDPPLHEFLPDLTELEIRHATLDDRSRDRRHTARLLEAARRTHEQNPMLGLRGVRLGLTSPGLYATQVRALAEAAAQLRAEGGDPRPEIMVPLVGDVRELRLIKLQAEQVLAEVSASTGIEVSCPIGTMIELPRAALTAGDLAADAAFFSFGTNDLTQTTWGFSRDDAEASFFPDYLKHKIFDVSPFQTIDPVVGSLVTQATAAGKSARPGLETGVCGEHGGDPASIRFFDQAGLDYVSCSPFRVLVARLEAGKAALEKE